MLEDHQEQTVTGEDSSTVKAESYPDLVNAVLFFVSQSMEEGKIQLTGYSGDVAEDLNRACLEVAKDDPLLHRVSGAPGLLRQPQHRSGHA